MDKNDITEEISQTEARIMQLKQTIFYAKEELEVLEFDLNNKQLKRNGVFNMRKIYNIKLIKKVTVNALDKLNIHGTWANIINESELYCTKALNGKDVEILFMRRKSLCKLLVTKEFAKEHFKLVAEAKNLEGKQIIDIIRKQDDENK